MTIDNITAIRAAYRRFLAPERILLTGHSHQGWPDVARAAQLEVFDDAVRDVDDKWSKSIFPLVAEVSAGIGVRMGLGPDEQLAFGESTHQLAYRLMTALDQPKPRILTTSGEFHSLRRQLLRLSEGRFEVDWLAAAPRDELADRLLARVGDGFDMVALSAVFFEDAYVLPKLSDILTRATASGAVVLVDAYHAFNVVPLQWGPAAEHIYITAGGYKYAGFGNGICWLRVPKNCQLRPEYTGWFADFASLEAEAEPARVSYGPGAQRFAGATFDASGLYRARAALKQWDALGLDVAALRQISLRQTERIIARMDERAVGVTLVSARQGARRGGFVSYRSPHAAAVVKALRARGVYLDARAEVLRLGPAPYLLDEEIDRGVDALCEVLKELS